MSIYIPGIEMPKDGWITLRIYPSGDVGIPNWQGDCRYHGIAIPVPDHGRLIDADALVHDLGAEDRDIYCEQVLEDAPTIIPASKEGE